MPERHFNTAGPIRPAEHYCVPPLTRWDLGEILSLVDQGKYFVLHAPRQTGKTSCLHALMEYLNREGRYRCVYANAEVGQSAREDVRGGMRAILGEISERARYHLRDEFLADRRGQWLNEYGEHAALNAALSHWSQASEKPLVLLIDEI
ncbi:MAG: ATP-binding protein, partial [Armatimonadetes bacterium]|nr:ATP-binding protein [Armatimonadota bacterium]